MKEADMERKPVKIRLKSRQTLGYQVCKGLVPTDVSSVLRNLYSDDEEDFYPDLFEKEHYAPEYHPQETDEALDGVLDLEGIDIGQSLADGCEDELLDEVEYGQDAVEQFRDVLEQIKRQLENEDDDTEEFSYITTGFIESGNLDSGEQYTEISFAENESLGGTLTNIRFFAGEKPSVEISHSGGVDSVLECVEKRRYRNSYRTPFGPMEFAMYTRRCRGKLEYPTGGRLELDYFVEIKGLDAQRTCIEIDVLPQ